MVDTFSYKPKLWESPTLVLQSIFGRPEGEGPEPRLSYLQGPHNPNEFAQKLYYLESLRPAALRAPLPSQPEPYTLQWFLDIEDQRHSKHGKWIPKLLEFAKHGSERLLGVGHGLGTDWVQYAQHGAEVIVCSPAKMQLELVRRNFELRELAGRFIQAEPTRLPLEDSSIDVVCISSLHHGIDHPEKVIAEAYRVLKPGGKVLAVTPAYFDVDYWVRTLFFWNRWFQPNTRGRDPLRLQAPAVRVAGGERSVCPRVPRSCVCASLPRLRRAEVPHVWRWLPLPILARLMGRVLVLKAFKPLNVILANGI